jgi:hypothetical protein
MTKPGSETVKLSSMTPTDDGVTAKELASVKRLISNFGGPVGVSLKKLGADSYIEFPAKTLRIRIGDLMALRSLLARLSAANKDEEHD